jgi:hypothetical protein
MVGNDDPHGPDAEIGADEDLGPEIGARLVPQIDINHIIPAEAVFAALAEPDNEED